MPGITMNAMELWGCGLNAHGQLNYQSDASPTPGDDVAEFTQVAQGNDIRLFLASWSQTALVLNSHLHVLGYAAASKPPTRALQIATPTPDMPQELASAFGDEDGLLGALCRPAGSLQLVSNASGSPPALVSQSTESTPRLSHIATTSASRTAVVLDPSAASTSAASTIQILEFPTYSSFLTWYSDPTEPPFDNDETSPCIRHVLPGRCESLIAGATAFTLLTSAGDVYTWGDARHASTLGRHVGASEPATLPAPVTSLGGLRVTKVAAGGWLGAAVTDAGDAYVWGATQEPGTRWQACIEPLKRAADADGVSRVVLGYPGPHNPVVCSEVVDIALGASHMVLLDGEGNVWSAGRNMNGQLGQGPRSKPYSAWWEMVQGLDELRERGKRIKGVACGESTSFVLVGDD